MYFVFIIMLKLPCLVQGTRLTQSKSKKSSQPCQYTKSRENCISQTHVGSSLEEAWQVQGASAGRKLCTERVDNGHEAKVVASSPQKGSRSKPDYARATTNTASTSVGREASAGAQQTTSTRLARIEQIAEESQHANNLVLHEDSKRKGNSASTKALDRMPATEIQHAQGVEGNAILDCGETKPEILLQSEPEHEASGSRAAGNAAGISFQHSQEESSKIVGSFVTDLNASGSEITSSSAAPVVQAMPDMSEFNPLRPEYPSFTEISEGRRKTTRRLHAEIVEFVAKNDAEADRTRWSRMRIVDKVRAAAQSVWENCNVDVYGSFSTNLFLPHRCLSTFI